MSLQVGDRVKYISKEFSDCEEDPLWGGKHGNIKGTVQSIAGKVINVKWDNKKIQSYGKQHLKITETLKFKIVTQ